MSDTCPSDSWLSSPDTVLVFSHFMTVTVTPLHLIGAFCILKRTPESMKSVKWTLLHFHFWNVVVDLMLNLFSVPIPLFPTPSGVLIGLLSKFGLRPTVQLWILMLAISSVCISTTMIFESRFRILNAKNVRWKKSRPYWILGNIAFCFLYMLPTMLQVPDQDQAKEWVLNEDEDYGCESCDFVYKHDSCVLKISNMNSIRPKMPDPCPSDSDSWLSSPDTVLMFSHVMAITVTPLHILGAYCILTKTPASMSSVKWTLFNFHIWNVLVDLMLNVFAIPFPLFPSASGFLLGVFSMLGMKQTIQLWILITSLCFVCFSTTMIFENRYRILNPKNVQWKKRHRIWIISNIVFCFAFLIPTIFQIPDQDEARWLVFGTLPCIPEFLFSTEIIVPSMNPLIIVFTALIFILVVFGQLVAFATLIIIQLSSDFGANVLSEATRRLQRKLLKALIWQTGIPVLYLVLPASCSMIAISTGIYSRPFNNIIVAITSLHGLVSTLSIILIHQPYRDTVAFWIKRQKVECTRRLEIVYPVFSTNTAQIE